MTKPSTQDANILADLADQLTAVSIALYQFRSYNVLSAEDELLIRDGCELPLDTMANLLRARAVEEVAKAALEKSEELKAALSKAQQSLEKVQQVKDAIRIVSDVLSLAGALLSKQPKAIVEALKPFTERKKKTKAVAKTGAAQPVTTAGAAR